MTILLTGGVRETIQRKIHEFVAPFMATGTPFEISQGMIRPYKCDINASNGSQEPAAPIISFVGNRQSSDKKRKCMDLSGSREVGFEHELRVIRTVYVGCCTNNSYVNPIDETLSPGNYKVLTRTWDHLSAIFAEKRQAQMDAGIHRSVFDFDPIQGYDKTTQLIYLMGSLEFTVFINHSGS